MSTFTVSSVTDGDTFEVQGGWKWTKSDGEVVNGTAVRPVGFDTPEKGTPGSLKAKEKLEKLILGKVVKLTNPVNLSYGRLVCDVHIDGKNLADHFKEFSA